MDTRVHGKKSAQPTQEYKEIEKSSILREDESIIKVDTVKNNDSFLDATIYNLCMKLQTQNQLETLYYQRKDTDSGAIPKFLKVNIHHPFYTPMIALPLIYMKFKKSLTLNKAMIVICVATSLNEHYKYTKCLETDTTLAKEYSEYNSNFNSLFGQLARSMTVKDVGQYIFQFDQDQQYVGSESHYDRDLVNESSFNLY